MKYTVYVTINLVNGKIYVGKHRTDDPNDSYLGSGKLLKLAIKKYGRDAFKKQVLYVFDNDRDMSLKEREIVSEQFVSQDSNYNLCVGGKGSFDYINSNKLNNANKDMALINKKISVSLRQYHKHKSTNYKYNKNSG